MIATSKKRIIAYLRRSTEDQENSIERQRLAFTTFLKNNPEEYYDDPEIYIEDGISGDASANRKVQQELLRVIEDGGLNVDEIFISEPSRWGRFSTHHKARFTLPLKTAGVALRTSTSLINFNDPTSDLLYDVHQNLSYIENHERSSRVVSGTATKVHNHKLKLPTCYGLKREGNRLVVDDEPAKLIKLIYDKFLETKSRNAVVSHLNITCQEPSPNGGKWSVQTVIKILKNPKLAGYYCYGRQSKGKIHSLDETVVPKQRSEKDKGKTTNNENFYQQYAPELVEPIISLDQFHKVQLLLLETSRSRIPTTGKRRLLQGKVKCACGRRCYSRTRNGDGIYICARGKAGGCTGAEFYESEILTTIYEYLKLLDDENVDLLESYHQEEEGIEDLSDDHLANLQRRYKTALDRINDLDGLLPDGFIEQTREIKRQIDRISDKRKVAGESKPTKPAIKELIKQYKSVKKDLTGQELIKKLVSLGIIKEVQLELAYQRRVERIMTGVKSHLIVCSMGKLSVDGTKVNLCSNQDFYFRRKLDLPRYFKSHLPISDDISRI